MKQELTYAEVVDAGREIVMGASWIEPFGFVFIAFGVIILSEMLYLTIKQKQELKKSSGKNWIKILLGISLILMPYWLVEGPTTEEKEIYKKERERWNRDFAAPYISEVLEMQVKTDIKEISYGEELAKKGKTYYATTKDEGRVLPIEIQTTEKKYELWVDVIVEEENEEERLEYQELEKMLNAGLEKDGEYLNPEPEYGKNYPPGIYNAKLYVSETTYEKLMDELQDLSNKKTSE